MSEAAPAAAAAAATTATTTTQTTETGGAPAAPAAPAPSTPAAPAAGAFAVPPEVLDWGANKGYSKDVMTKVFSEMPDIYKMATSYRETEKMLHAATGADKIILPKDINDFTQVAPALEKLGAPAKASDYNMEIPQGADSQFALTASEKFAELKLLPAQAQGLNKWWNEYGATLKAQEAAKEAKEARDSALKLETEWGADLDINSKISGRALNAVAPVLGWDANKIEAVKSGDSVKLSAYEFGKLMKYVGDAAKLTGDTFEGAGHGQGAGNSASGHTPETAKAEIRRLTADPAFAKRLLAKDADAKKQLDELYKIGGGGGVTTLA